MLNLENYHITHNNEALHTGKVLIATPFSSSSVFAQSVVLLIEHSENQSVGLFLNKQLPPKVSKEINRLFSQQLPLQSGGPLGVDELFYLHTLGSKIPRSTQILPNIYVGGEFETVQDYIADDNTEGDFRFFVGYCGWGKNQLQREFNNNEWIVTTLTRSAIFAADTKNLWKNSLETMGGKYKMWAEFPKNPAYN
ncbi:MAG: YqgE/AlgH family protein [Bacteroidales bacterium]|jgi:putative transcriptional regulator|nr:YqgE/AlgH family protein [Bacteroidales bacterium]